LNRYITCIETLKSSFSNDDLPDVVLSEPKLSDMLYRNSKKVAAESLAILNDGIRAKKPIKQMAMKLYDGYGFNDKEVLDVKRKLPLYLRRELENGKVSDELIRYVDNIKTKPLKTALKQIIDKIDDTNKIGLQKALKVALEEKSRYYANRIADTEHHRAANLARAKEYIDDAEVEYVKHSMSSRHPMVDICDYYNNLDSGYGKGIYKKESAVALPHHPHYHCRYHAHYDKVTKRTVKDPEKETLEKFSIHERRAILGSHDKLRRFYEGESVKDIFNSSRPDYPIRSYGEVLGYNGGMETVFKDFGDALKHTTENKKIVTHKRFAKYNQHFNNIILATKNKTENAVIIRDGKLIKQISGLKREVSVPHYLIKNSVVIHNHPSGTSFSKEDIVLGIEHKAQKLIVFHPDTYIYEANVQGVSLNIFQKEYAIIANIVDEYLNDAIAKGANENIANFEKQHYILSELARRNHDFKYKRYKY